MEAVRDVRPQRSLHPVKRLLLLALLAGCASSGPRREAPTLYVQMRMHSQAAIYIDGRRIGTVYKNSPCIELRNLSHGSNRITVRADVQYTVTTPAVPLLSRDGWTITIDGVRPSFDAISLQPSERCTP